MSISAQVVIKVCEARLATDDTLNQLNNAVSANNIDLTEAIDIAVRFGNVARTRPNITETKLADGIVAAYKAATYRKLNSIGIQFNNDPQLHTQLTNMFEEVVTFIRTGEASVQSSGLSGGLRLGGLGGNGVNAGGSLSIDSGPSLLATNPGLPIESSGGLNVSGGLPVNNTPKAPATSPLASMPVSPLVPENNQPMAGPAPTGTPYANEPIISPIEELTLESYAEHELETPSRRVSITAREANERVTEYAATQDWKKPLEDLIAGTTPAVYYRGADIAVRLRRQERTYLAGITDDARERMRAFIAQHLIHVETLREIPKQNLDGDRIVKLVDATVKAMKKSIIELYVDAVKESDEETEVVVSENVRFVNAYLGMLTMLVHNGLSLATDRCAELPGKYKNAQLERNMDDLGFFADTMYQATLGENGYTKEPDFFRDLFLTVANSVSTFTVVATDEATVCIKQDTYDILIPGNYPTLTRSSMVGKHSLGATADPVADIYETLRAGVPGANVYLVAPQARYLLLSNGEPTANIRY